MANIMDVISAGSSTVKRNDTISWLYIIYQAVLFGSSILGPGTTFLMIVGAIDAALPGTMEKENSIYWSFVFNLVPIIIFIIICFAAKQDIQLKAAGLLTGIYSIAMMVVVVGTMVQVAEQGPKSPSAMFLWILLGAFVGAALLHPREIMCVIHLLLYFLTVPSTFIFLIIYSLCNLNNVSWGTRETKAKKTKEQLQAEKEKEETMKKAKENHSWLSFLGITREMQKKMESTFSIGCHTVCRLMCCLEEKKPEQSPELLTLVTKVETVQGDMKKIMSKLDIPHDVVTEEPKPIIKRTKTTKVSIRAIPSAVPEDDEEYYSDTVVLRDDMVNPFWIEDSDLKAGKRDNLDDVEISFWRDMIRKYLEPMEGDKKRQEEVAAELKELRNNIVLAVLMLNGLFVTVIFFLQINPTVHVEWPLDPTGTQTLDPIGFAFLLFYVVILLLQFIAMLFHRLGTFMHIMATTTLSMCRKAVPTPDGDDDLKQNGLKIAKEMQTLKDADRSLEADEKLLDEGVDMHERYLDQFIQRGIQPPPNDFARRNTMARHSVIHIVGKPARKERQIHLNTKTLSANAYKVSMFPMKVQ